VLSNVGGCKPADTLQQLSIATLECRVRPCEGGPTSGANSSKSSQTLLARGIENGFLFCNLFGNSRFYSLDPNIFKQSILAILLFGQLCDAVNCCAEIHAIHIVQARENQLQQLPDIALIRRLTNR
jgi:hypothetical protein